MFVAQPRIAANGPVIPWQDLVPARPTAKTHPLFLPYQARDVRSSAGTCPAIPGASFDALTVLPPPTDRPAAEHADLNLGLRGMTPVAAARDYVWIGGPTDPLAPDLKTLFQTPQRPAITQTYQVYDWNWDCNCRAGPIQSPEVTFIDVEASPDTILTAPASGYHLGDGYEVLVLYAEPSRITLKYTRDDNVVSGYTLHLEDICVEPTLLQLYQTLDASGREQLPALRSGQPFARARGQTVGLAIRDTGRFMDPRSLKDWWAGDAREEANRG
ncbi:MAG: hypothetical protein GXP42_09385 [Chloroflexi bacterium]|nr:hypothetical protein [Chloroflexota bacterium]